MSKSRVFLLMLLALLSGVFLGSFFEISQNTYFLVIIFALIIIFAFYRNKKIVVMAAAALFVVLGIQHVDAAFQKANEKIFENVIIRENAVVQKAVASTYGQNLIAQFEKTDVLVLISTPQYPQYQYGDEINVICTLKIIENKDAEFDYRMYMAKDRVFYQCDKAKIKFLAANKGNAMYAKILQTRNALEKKIFNVIPQPEGALADGLLFGGSVGLPKEIQAAFSKTGMTHIVAVSGYNVTIIAEYLMVVGIFLGLWRPQAIWFAAAGIIIFVVMSGLPASAVRAGFMATILLWAMKNGRLANAENAIIFAAAIMLWQNPLLLRYDVGFQLSFLATLGIVLTSDFWEKSFVKKHKALGISETIAMSLSAQVFVLPIIAINFHLTSCVSLLANILILPIIPLSMLLVFLVAVFGFIFNPLAIIFSWLAYLLLHWELWIIQILADFPWASVNIDKFNVWWVFVYYVILILVVVKLKSHLSLVTSHQNEVVTND